ncbi:hypothetical protein DRW48_04385 [Paracoccus suum]|uniref:Uncharacterized protein n=1 Tax=Paracoccus suum TaxID=2259340 RepID=A0A344PI24_9RHOB|nr:hypothetical protein [Paracoccus suum]AXC49029.1 hypothetical protein DRW48_04385 [Paracoccus suum]
MSRDTQLEALARIARLKADIELKHFSALRRHIATLDARVEDLRMEIIRVADGAVRAWPDEGAGAAGGASTEAKSGDRRVAAGGDRAQVDDRGPDAFSREHVSPVRLMRAAGVPAAQRESDPQQPLRDLRLANALTRAAMVERQAVEAERLRMTPQFEAARNEATRAFGRAEAVAALGRQISAVRRRSADRRSGE